MTRSVSIIFVSYHTGPALWAALASALRAPECLEVLLVDNGNPPGVQAELSAYAKAAPRLKLVQGHGNVGFARACNIGVRRAKGEQVLLLNPDSLLPDDGLAHALAALALYPGNTLVGGVIIHPDGREQRGSRRALLTPQNAVVESLGLHRFSKRFARVNFHESATPDAPTPVPAISGACLFLTREFYLALGGLDEGYFLHMEDMDFCYRVHQAGGRVISAPGLRVLHFRSTSEVPSTFVEAHKTRGFVRYLMTHFKHSHSASTLVLFRLGIWARHYAKRVVRFVDSLFLSPLLARQEVARLAALYCFGVYSEQRDIFAGRRLIVTGATGQLGICLVAKALARGAMVVACTRGDPVPFAHPRLIWQEWDMDEPLPSGLTGDAVLHAAPHALLAPHLAAFAAQGMLRVIAFQPAEEAEDGALHAASAQGVGCDLTMFRTTLLYGIGLDKTLAPLADTIRRWGRLLLYPPASGARMPVLASDVADAALAALLTPAASGNIYALGGGETLTVRAMYERLFAYYGKPPRFWTLKTLPSLLHLLGRVYDVPQVNRDTALGMNEDKCVDNGIAIAELGYAPHLFLQNTLAL